MERRNRCCRVWVIPYVVAVFVGAPGAALIAQAPIDVPLAVDRWIATDSISVEEHLGRRSLFINRGVALLRDVELRDGTLEFDMAATAQSTFLGVSFHAAAPNFSEVIFFRVGQTGTNEAVQYGPAFNNLGVAWQVFRGPGATATTDLPRGRWLPVRVVLAGDTATLFLHGSATPTLIVPRLAGSPGAGVGVWTGLFGRGAYFSNFRYTASPRATAPASPAVDEVPDGALVKWELSQVIAAEEQVPGILPDPATLRWESVDAERGGVVLINRYREAPVAAIPFDPLTRRIYVDSVMGGRVKGTKVVYARTSIRATSDTVRRMHFGYSDGVVIHLNGQPLFFGMNAQSFRDQGVMTAAGDAVYLPLRRGDNDLVVAITEYTGGWAFWARLDAR